jgi:hypothetical protein
MRRPSAANLRRLAAAEATRRDVETISPLIPVVVHTREDIARLEAFNFPGPNPKFPPGFPIPESGGIDCRDIFRFIEENARPSNRSRRDETGASR